MLYVCCQLKKSYVMFLKITKLDLVWVDVCAVFILAILKDEQFFMNTMQGRIQDFWSRCSNVLKGVHLPNLLKFSMKMKLFPEGGSCEPLEPPLNPPLQCKTF